MDGVFCMDMKTHLQMMKYRFLLFLIISVLGLSFVLYADPSDRSSSQAETEDLAAPVIQFAKRINETRIQRGYGTYILDNTLCHHASQVLDMVERQGRLSYQEAERSTQALDLLYATKPYISATENISALFQRADFEEIVLGSVESTHIGIAIHWGSVPGYRGQFAKVLLLLQTRYIETELFPDVIEEPTYVFHWKINHQLIQQTRTSAARADPYDHLFRDFTESLVVSQFPPQVLLITPSGAMEDVPYEFDEGRYKTTLQFDQSGRYEIRIMAEVNQRELSSLTIPIQVAITEQETSTSPLTDPREFRSTNHHTGSMEPTEVAAFILDQVNQTRSASNIPPLSLSEHLTAQCAEVCSGSLILYNRKIRNLERPGIQYLNLDHTAINFDTLWQAMEADEKLRPVFSDPSYTAVGICVCEEDALHYRVFTLWKRHLITFTEVQVTADEIVVKGESAFLRSIAIHVDYDYSEDYLLHPHESFTLRLQGNFDDFTRVRITAVWNGRVVELGAWRGMTQYRGNS